MNGLAANYYWAWCVTMHVYWEMAVVWTFTGINWHLSCYSPDFSTRYHLSFVRNAAETMSPMMINSYQLFVEFRPILAKPE